MDYQTEEQRESFPKNQRKTVGLRISFRFHFFIQLRGMINFQSCDFRLEKKRLKQKKKKEKKNLRVNGIGKEGKWKRRKKGRKRRKMEMKEEEDKQKEEIGDSLKRQV